MVLTRRGDQSFGDSQADIRAELLRYSRLNGYLTERFADAACPCGGRVFRLLVDETEGAAVRICGACSTEHAIGDSSEYLEDAELEECECPCGRGTFELTVGVSLYKDSTAVKWLYLGCRCPACGQAACYGDWKNEFEDYRELLDRI
jgi:hypothetical protein